MKNFISAPFLATLAVIMLLPVAGRVNAMSVDQSVMRQAGNPLPTGGGGHFTLRQAGNPLPTGGGGHFTLRQAGNPLPTGGGGH
jgi:hypothetical protein